MEELPDVIPTMISRLQSAEDFLRRHQQSPRIEDIPELDRISQDIFNDMMLLNQRYGLTFKWFLLLEKPIIPGGQGTVHYTQVINVTRVMDDHFMKLMLQLGDFMRVISKAKQAIMKFSNEANCQQNLQH